MDEYYRLSNFQLASYMLQDPYIRSQYGGVVAIDKLPDLVLKKPKIFIVNTDTSKEPGEHWFVIYVTDRCEYFDPAGLPALPDAEIFMTKHSANYLANTERTQSYISYTCGLFCLFYAYFRCRNVSFKNIMNMFHENLHVNEAIVQHFYELTK